MREVLRVQSKDATIYEEVTKFGLTCDQSIFFVNFDDFGHQMAFYDAETLTELHQMDFNET